MLGWRLHVTERDDAAKPQRPAIPQDMKAFNRALIEEWRADNGKLSGRVGGRNLTLLTTTGARSGMPRTVGLALGRHGDNIVAIASDNGAPAHPAWYVNLLADPIATVEVGADQFEVRARTGSPEEREALAKVVPYL